MGSTRFSGAVQGVVLLLVTANAGCLAITIGSTKKQELDRTEVDVRVSSSQADLDGQLCYVDKKDRVVSKVQVALHSKTGEMLQPWAVLEFLVGGVMLAVERLQFDEEKNFISRDGRPWGLIPMVDALAAGIYIFLRDDSVSTSESWKRTSDTASCAL